MGPDERLQRQNSADSKDTRPFFRAGESAASAKFSEGQKSLARVSARPLSGRASPATR